MVAEISAVRNPDISAETSHGNVLRILETSAGKTAAWRERIAQGIELADAVVALVRNPDITGKVDGDSEWNVEAAAGERSERRASWIKLTNAVIERVRDPNVAAGIDRELAGAVEGRTAVIDDERPIGRSGGERWCEWPASGEGKQQVHVVGRMEGDIAERRPGADRCTTTGRRGGR